MKNLQSILLIDDSDATNELNRYYFEEMGLEDKLTIMKNGKEALNYLQSVETLPEVIFLDVKMPVMDGFEFLEEFTKTHEGNLRETRIVLLTTSSNLIDLKEAEKYTVIADVLMKPLDEVKIKNILQQLDL